MKANELDKKSIKIEEVYKNIQGANESHGFKIFYPHCVYVEEKVIMQLVSDGFKVYRGTWDAFTTDVLIIEW